MTVGTEESSKKKTLEECLKEWAFIRPELDLPGYWPTLTENCNHWASEIDICSFWREFERQRPSWSNEFHQKTRGSLLARNELPKFCGKQHDRIRSKLFQLSIGKGAKKPDFFWSKEGAPVPRLNDLVRTRVECQFVDGVEFIGNKLEELASAQELKVERERKGQIEGYFAQHLYFDYDVLFRIGGEAQQATIQCEVQIATQLATRIWFESHNIYEQWRERHESHEEWQWDPRDNRFIARQLGHMIHLADGLLVQLRDAQRSGRK